MRQLSREREGWRARGSGEADGFAGVGGGGGVAKMWERDRQVIWRQSNTIY